MENCDYPAPTDEKYLVELLGDIGNKSETAIRIIEKAFRKNQNNEAAEKENQDLKSKIIDLENQLGCKSYLAQKYALKLEKIKKEHPEYFEETQEKECEEAPHDPLTVIEVGKLTIMLYHSILAKINSKKQDKHICKIYSCWVENGFDGQINVEDKLITERFLSYDEAEDWCREIIVQKFKKLGENKQ